MFFNKEAVEIEVEISNLRKDIIENLEKGLEPNVDKQKKIG